MPLLVEFAFSLELDNILNSKLGGSLLYLWHTSS